MESIMSELKRRNIIHVRGIGETVTEDDLLQLFGKVGKVSHLDLWMDSFPYHAILIYGTEEEAKKAVELLDYKVFHDNVLRVKFPAADIRADKTNTNGCAKVSITNVNMNVNREELKGLFEDIGKVVNFDVIPDEKTSRQPDVYSVGSGVVEFLKEEDAKSAIEKLDYVNINDITMRVDPYTSEREEEEEKIERLRRTVLVKNYSVEPFSADRILGGIGMVIGETFEGSEDQYSPECVYCVTFEKIEEAALAVKKLNGHKDGNKFLSVTWALTKSELDEKMKKYEVIRNSCIVVKNLNESVSDKHLREMFSPFGEVTSCEVDLYSQDKSTRSGYVKFSYAKDATNAVDQMNGKMITGKRLSVAFDESKGEKRAKVDVVGETTLSIVKSSQPFNSLLGISRMVNPTGN